MLTSEHSRRWVPLPGRGSAGIGCAARVVLDHGDTRGRTYSGWYVWHV